LTPAEVANFLKVPEVRKDDLNSGKNQFTGVDLCNWYVKEGSPEGIGVTLRTAMSDDEGGRMTAYSSAKGDALEHDVKRSLEAQRVPVGDEAVYSGYPVPPGGSTYATVRFAYAHRPSVISDGSDDQSRGCGLQCVKLRAE